MSSFLIRSGTLITTATKQVIDTLISDGLIAKIAAHDSPTYALPAFENGKVGEVIEAEGKLMFPGLIDCHVHFREPGLTRKGDMATESAAALAGGVTTVCDMPNTVPPTVTIEALRDKVERAKQIKGVDIRFFFGITKRDHLAELKALWTSSEHHVLRAKCCGVKVFLDHSTGNQRIDETLIEDLWKTCAELSIPIVCHCEDATINEALMRENTRDTVAVHSELRPPKSEEKAIEYAIGLTRKFSTPLHIAHLSTSRGLELVKEAKDEGLSVTCEVSPHHLFLTVDDYAQLGTFAKMNPPLRTIDHRDALWGGIRDGIVDCISTDHAPHMLEEKQNMNPLKVPSGVPGVATMLPLLLTVAAGGWPHPTSKKPRSAFTYEDIVRLCFEGPNRIFHLGKQSIGEGARADIVIVDPKESWTIHAHDLPSVCGWTPFEGWEVKGRIVRVTM